MTSDAVKIAKSNERLAMINTAREVLTNPVVLVVGSFILIEALQKTKNQDGTYTEGRGIVGPVAGTVLEGGLATYLLSPTIGKFAEQIGPVAKAFGEVAGPLALMAGK